MNLNVISIYTISRPFLKSSNYQLSRLPNEHFNEAIKYERNTPVGWLLYKLLRIFYNGNVPEFRPTIKRINLPPKSIQTLLFECHYVLDY